MKESDFVSFLARFLEMGCWWGLVVMKVPPEALLEPRSWDTSLVLLQIQFEFALEFDLKLKSTFEEDLLMSL